MSEVTILIADDHEIVREGLRAVLAARPEWQVCGEAVNGHQAVEKALACRPHVAVLDFAMPELNGLEAARRIRKEVPETEVLMLTMHSSERLAHEALEAGARGFLLKSDAKRYLILAVEALSRHEAFFTPKVSAMVLNGYLAPAVARRPEPPVERLTPREREIVQLVAEGRTTKEVAAHLGLSEKTVETHRSNIARRLNLRSAVDLVRYAIRNELIEP